MMELDRLASSIPDGSTDLNEETYLDSIAKPQTLEQGSAYEQAMRKRLLAKGLNEQQVERRMSLGRRKSHMEVE